MKIIDRAEVLGLAEYEQVRERFRSRVIAEKKVRRVQVGPHVTVVFENRDTVLLQIQEMLRTERITRAAAIQHEIDTYNELVPGEAELSCTLMVAIPEKEAREAFLVAAAGLERHVWLESPGVRVRARSAPRDGAVAERTTAVHYLKFALPGVMLGALRGAGREEDTLTQVELVIDHPACPARAVLPVATLVALGQDLEG